MIHLKVVEQGKSTILCYCACSYIFFEILDRRKEFAQQIQVKAKLVDYKIWKWIVISRLMCPFRVGEVGFIYHDRVTSYNLWRHILHTCSQSRLCVLRTECTLLFFFNEYTDDNKIIIIKAYILFPFILDINLNSQELANFNQMWHKASLGQGN